MSSVRTARLLFNTWKQRIASACEGALRWLDQQFLCPHRFRPACIADKPGRVCRICEKSEQITLEEFYAEFGERYQAMLCREIL